MIEQLERDTVRLRAAYATTNRNPLGACAITGTGFPIDRDRTTELLGFDAPTGNTYGSIATVDYLLESVSAATVLLTGLGRVLQDLLLWCTSEFGYLRLDRRVRAGQQHHAAEAQSGRARARARDRQQGAGAGVGHRPDASTTLRSATSSTPRTICSRSSTSMFNDANRAVRLVAAAMGPAQFNRARLAERAEQGWITVTELADTLARDHDVPFKTSHRIAVEFVAGCERRPSDPRSAVLREVAVAVIGRAIEYDEPALATLLSARHFVAVRTTPGGPAPSETRRAIAASRGLLASDGDWCTQARARLAAADATLRTVASTI